jgi:ankyrin repeat protein
MYPLYLAVKGNHTDAALLLLKYGAITHIPSVNYPIDEASKNDNIVLVRELLLNGAHINTGDIDGLTPLHYMSRSGHNDIVRLLIDHGANINQRDNYTFTPLYYACCHGNLDVIKTLIDTGKVDINITCTKYQWPPLYTACLHRHINVIKLLIANGANVNATNSKGSSILSKLKARKYQEVIALLKDHGAIE